RGAPGHGQRGPAHEHPLLRARAGAEVGGLPPLDAPHRRTGPGDGRRLQGIRPHRQHRHHPARRLGGAGQLQEARGRQGGGPERAPPAGRHRGRAMSRGRRGPRVHVLAWGLLLVLPDRAVRAQEAEKLPGWAWTASLFAEETWDSNVSFSRQIDVQGQPSSFITRPLGTLAYERTGSHSQFALALRGGGFVYHAQPDLNQFDGGATVAGTFQTTPRLQLDLREAFTYAY